MLIEILQLGSSFTLGLLMGSLLTEALILVPYWRNMDPDDVLKLHGTLGPRLYGYFAPLTILATLLPVVTVVVALLLGDGVSVYSMLSALLVLLMLAIYFVYFKAANESFETGTVGVAGVSAELARWAKWHWLRVILGLAAFLASLLN